MFNCSRDSNMISFPLPPNSSLQGHCVGSNHQRRLIKPPRRLDSIPRKPESVDVNLYNLSSPHQSLDRSFPPSKDDSYYACLTKSSPQVMVNNIIQLPRFPQGHNQLQSIPSIVPLEPAGDFDVQSIKTVKKKCARYPITYKLKTPSDFHLTNSSQIFQSKLWTPKTSVDQPSHVEDLGPPLTYPSPHYTSVGSTSSDGETYPCKSVIYTRVQPTRMSSFSKEENHHSSASKPASATYYTTSPSHLSSPPQSAIEADHGPFRALETNEDNEFESIQTEKIDNLENRSDNSTIFPKKPSVLERPRPLGRERSQSFTSPYAEFEQLTTLQRSNSCSIKPGRCRRLQPSQLPMGEKPTLNHRASSLNNLRGINRQHKISRPCFSGSEGATTAALHRTPSFMFGNRFSSSSRQSFFSTLAKLDSDAVSLNLELRLPDTEKPKLRLEPSVRKNCIRSAFEWNSKVEPNKLKKTKLERPVDKPLPQLRRSETQTRKPNFELKRLFSLRELNHASARPTKSLFGCLGA